MKSENLKTALLKAFGIAGAAVLIYGGFAALFGERAVPTAFAQSDAFLSRRIDQIENRFYGIESRISRLETAPRPSSITSPITQSITSTNDIEIQNLRAQVDLLRIRLGEAECGLLKLDERTLTTAARASRAKAALTPQPCRQDAAAPVMLSARP